MFLVFDLEPVVEHSAALVQEALGDLNRFPSEFIRLHHEQPLDHARDVAQVKDVVELACCRTELGTGHNRLLDLVDCLDERLCHRLDFTVELRQMVEQDGLVDTLDCFSVWHADRDRGEEALGTIGDLSASHLGVEGSDEHAFVERDEQLEVFAEVDSLLVDDFLEQLDSALRVVVVCEGHVDIVDELKHLLERVLGSVLAGLHLVHFGHDEVVECE